MINQSLTVKSVLDTIATVAVIVVCVLGGWTLLRGSSVAGTGSASAPPAVLPAGPVSLDGAVTRGSAAARVVVIEYSEFQCSFCAKFNSTVWPALDEKYVSSGRVRWAFRHLPLEGVHPHAFRAAEAAACASAQGRFWEMHDLLFANRETLDEESLFRRAQTLRLAPERFSRCMQGESADRIRQDAAAGRLLGVTGTPTFLFGVTTDANTVQLRDRIVGVVPIAVFEATLDRLLAGR